MKTRIYSSLLAMLLLNFFANFTYAQADKVYDHVSLENPPMFPGGIKKFYEYLGGEMKYPLLASENNVQGTINVSFMIEKDGSLSDIKTEGRKLGYGLEEEATRVIKSSKPWIPGLLNGNPVRVKYNLPVKFAMPNKPKQATSVTTTPSASAKASIPTGNNTVYSHVNMENPPTYPGGIAKFYEFLGQNIVYPKAASNNKIQGTVRVSFTIEKDGSLTEIKNLNEVGAGTEEEAIRVMKLSKKWNPGLVNGEPVRVKYQLPIKFAM